MTRTYNSKWNAWVSCPSPNIQECGTRRNKTWIVGNEQKRIEYMKDQSFTPVGDSCEIHYLVLTDDKLKMTYEKVNLYLR